MDKNGEKGFVYLLGDWEKEGFFKIGVTRGRIENRIKELQTGNSGEIYMCSYFQTSHPFLMEKELHTRFRPKKILGEWFELSNEEATNFRSVCEELEEMNKSLMDNPFFRKNLNRH